MTNKKLAISVLLLLPAFSANAADYVDVYGQPVQTNSSGQYYDPNGQLMQATQVDRSGQYGQQPYQNLQQHDQSQQYVQAQNGQYATQQVSQQDRFPYTQQQIDQQNQLTLEYHRQMLLLKQAQQAEVVGSQQNSLGLGTIVRQILK